MKIEFRQAQLDNGLTVIAEVNPAAASMAMGFFVATGSRDETPAEAGVSHFLEHMVFKGTPRRTTLDVNRELDEMGADSNAGTTEENTIFYASVLPEFQPRVVDLLCDILRPSLRQEDFDLEKKVILDEIALYDDQPHFRLYEKLMGEFFRSHPLGNSILGTRESIGALSREQMLDYFGRRYCAGNIIAVAAGKLDFDRFVEDLGRLCGAWPAGQPTRPLPPSPSHCARCEIVDEKVVRQNLGLMSPAPAASDPARHAAHLLSSVVGDGTGSRLYYALIEKGLADEASMSYSSMDGAGAFMTFLSCDPEKTKDILAITREELERFQKDGPSEAELLAAKNKTATGQTLKGELPIGRLSDVGFDWMYRRQYQPLGEVIDELFAVPGEQVLELARRMDLTQTTLVTLGPAKMA
jgi:predicted Zn-dependent peptidase